MQNIFNLQNKNIIITGGYGHLGGEMSLALGAAGATVWCFGRTEKSFADFLVQHSGQADNLRFVHCDASQMASVETAVDAVVGTVQHIDVLINNAASVQGNNPEALSHEDLDYTFSNVLGSIQIMTQAVLPFMVHRGSIINVSSMYGLVSPDFRAYKDCPEYLNPPHYGAAKAGVIQLTRYFANYLAEREIRVNALVPGAFPSETVQKNQGFMQALTERIPLRRIGQPKELVGPVLFLASHASSYMTGQSLVIDGGWTSL